MNFTAASEATPSFGWNPSGSARQPGPGFRDEATLFKTGKVDSRPHLEGVAHDEVQRHDALVAQPVLCGNGRHASHTHTHESVGQRRTSRSSHSAANGKICARDLSCRGGLEGV
eukprot:7800999-Pyramimonas_sp.AAC.1